MIVFYLIILLVILAGVFYQKDKLIYFLQFTCMYILMAFNGDIMDHQNYKLLYEEMTFTRVPRDKLYYLFTGIAKKCGLSFEQYNYIVSFVCLLVLFAIISKLIYNKRCLIISLLFVFPFTDYIIQRRNFMALAFLSLGIYYVLKTPKNKYKNVLIFSFFVLLASSCHFTFWVYLIFNVIFLVDEKRIKKLAIFVLISGTICCGVILRIMLSLVGSMFSIYLTGVASSTSLIVILLFAGFHCIEVFMCDKLLENSEKNIYGIKIIKRINYMSLCFIPLYFIDTSFFRMYKNLMIFIYYSVFSSSVSATSNVRSSNLRLIKSVALILVIIFALMVYLVDKTADGTNVLQPIIENNIVFQFMNPF